MKLIENTEFGLQCKSKEKEFKTRLEYLDWYEKKRNNYDNLLNQPLKLEYFVLCDDEGNVLEEPNKHEYFGGIKKETFAYQEYKRAKSKVLFDGFDVLQLNQREDNEVFLHIKIEKMYFSCWFKYGKVSEYNEEKTIEDILKLNLTLTPNAIKQFNL